MEHRGVSLRTGLPLKRPLQSAIRNHAASCGGMHGDVLLDDFKLLGGSRNIVDLRIIESLFIHTKSPNLNETASAFPLKIVNRF